MEGKEKGDHEYVSLTCSTYVNSPLISFISYLTAKKIVYVWSH